MQNIDANREWQDFLYFLNTANDADYGDFKRRVDTHISPILEASRTWSHEDQRALQAMRTEYLWKDHENIEVEPMRRYIEDTSMQISQIH